MTVYELKARNVANGGHFFDRATLKMYGDTLKGFGVSRDVDPALVVVTRKRDGNQWWFRKSTGRFLATKRA